MRGYEKGIYYGFYQNAWTSRCYYYRSPRDGMHKDVIAQIIGILPQRIVYVSCNAATQARDLALLDAHYKVTRVQPVDMFPQTFHVENVVCLEKDNVLPLFLDGVEFGF